MAIRFTTELFDAKTTNLLKDFTISQDTTNAKWLANPGKYYAPVNIEVAWDDKEPIGWSGVGSTRGKQRLPLLSVFVLPAYRAKGVGTKLVNRVLKAYKDPHELNYLTYDQASWPQLEKLIEAEGYLAFDIESVREVGTKA